MSSPPAPLDFQRLYADWAGRVHRYALLLSGNAATAEDVVAETFVRVWGARDRVDLTTVGSYLLAIARNVYLQSLRRHTRLDSLDLERPDPRPGPEALHAVHAELRAVLAQLDHLPPVDRTALLLRADEGLSYHEIGALLNLSAVAVRVKVHRARARLAAMREETP